MPEKKPQKQRLGTMVTKVVESSARYFDALGEGAKSVREIADDLAAAHANLRNARMAMLDAKSDEAFGRCNRQATYAKSRIASLSRTLKKALARARAHLDANRTYMGQLEKALASGNFKV